MRSTFTLPALITATLFAPMSVANAQGTTTTTRPAGTDFSVTTGIGSSASATTHKVEPGPPREGSPIYGLFQSPDESESNPDAGKIDQAKPVDSGVRPSPSQVPDGPNAIARDRIESPQDR